MRKLFTPIAVALVALTALAATTQQADARRYRGVLAFGVGSAIIGGAIIAHNRPHYRYYGYGGYNRYPYGYGGYDGYPNDYGYNNGGYSAAYAFDDDYDGYDYDYTPRRSYYYGYAPAYSYGYAPRRYYGGGYRIIHPRRHHYAKVRRHGSGKHVHKARYRD
ncbi:MAG: hypothetical protein ACKVP4_03490 [Hyphomicrobium sp.]